MFARTEYRVDGAATGRAICSSSSAQSSTHHCDYRLLVALACLGAAWWLVAPPALGGSTSVVTVDGTSMLPSLQRDDLVALRRSRAYQVGDVVAYRSVLLNHVVLHRIVRIEHRQYTFKGDNNAFLDPEHPTEAQLVGRLSGRASLRQGASCRSCMSLGSLALSRRSSS